MSLSAAPASRIYALVLAVCVLRFWIMPLGSSLWLDESTVIWLGQVGLREAIGRVLEWPTQSIPYMTIAWLAQAVGGHSEWVIRLPSVAAMAAATAFVYRLGERLIDREAAWIACIAFTCD